MSTNHKELCYALLKIYSLAARKVSHKVFDSGRPTYIPLSREPRAFDNGNKIIRCALYDIFWDSDSSKVRR